MTVRELTLAQKDILVGQTWGYQGQLFNPVQDVNDKWIISNEEVNGCTLAQAQLIGCDVWLTSLPEITFEPKPSLLP